VSVGGVARLTAVAMLVAVSGCESEEDAIMTPGDGDPFFQDNASAWLGVYEGSGSGLVSGDPVDVAIARLTVRLDPAAVRDENCPRCVTVELDTLFVLNNVAPLGQSSLTLSYGDGTLRRSLRLDRYSGGGGVGNVVAARFVLDSIMGGEVGEIEYVLHRR